MCLLQQLHLSLFKSCMLVVHQAGVAHSLLPIHILLSYDENG